MVRYEILLQFVRANCEGVWQLHLTSLNAMILYFFVHDQTNYARHSPLYLATMKELEHNDRNSWNYLKENFSINKSGIPLCSVGSDHVLEQENRSLKITGGVKGLTQEPTVYTAIVSLLLHSMISPKLFAKNIKSSPQDEKLTTSSVVQPTQG